jgi:hypothetical protein
METIINTVFVTVLLLAAAFACATVVWASMHISRAKNETDKDLANRRQFDLEELERRIM